MKRPEVKDMAAALRCYYGAGYIGNKEIQEIFGKRSSGTVARLKKAVRAVPKRKQTQQYQDGRKSLKSQNTQRKK